MTVGNWPACSSICQEWFLVYLVDQLVVGNWFNFWKFFGTGHKQANYQIIHVNKKLFGYF